MNNRKYRTNRSYYRKNYAYPDKYIQHGSVEELEKIYGLDEESIQKDIEIEESNLNKIS